MQSRTADAFDVDAVEEHGERGGVELRGHCARGDEWPLEAPAFEALDVEDEAATVPREDFYAVCAFAYEDEERSAKNVDAEGRGNERSERIEAFTHIDWPGGHEDTCRRRQR
jgi:hypothetical protein